ncbi:hypothetical protein [Sulfuriroseicoccus oceanibius]|uniref:Uncharacterized protein n=1 Tax=Sulfuriroseicoccus oceanibius TaxID=2707525 RepID=A0A6B3L534_9BACT|nr:hypothetical protein [Sulfuriroseicoccus oceanibius]QQL44772.1 hypothetical protein G3M56_012965 [Sulfuriroseicoccus oceanibius]
MRQSADHRSCRITIPPNRNKNTTEDDDLSELVKLEAAKIRRTIWKAAITIIGVILLAPPLIGFVSTVSESVVITALALTPVLLFVLIVFSITRLALKQKREQGS